MSQYPNASQPQNSATLMEAQQSALEMASKLSALTFNFAVELNKNWFDWVQKQTKQYANVQQRLANCRTPEEVFSAQAELIGKAAQNYKDGLSAHADLVGKATQDYKQGLDQFANAGEELSHEAARAMGRVQETARSAMGQAVHEMNMGQQEAENRTKGRAKTEGEDQAKRAH